MRAILFTLKTCPKCPSFKAFVQAKMPPAVEFEEINDEQENFADKVKEFDIRQAPTLIILDNAGQEIDRIHEQAEFEDFFKKYPEIGTQSPAKN